MKKHVNLIISLFCFPIFNLIYLKVFEYINGKIQETFDIKYMIILTIIKLIIILFLGFMLAYYYDFISKQEKKKLGIFLLIEIFILIIYVVTKKCYLPENFFYIFDFNLLYFMLLLGENVFLFLHFNKLEQEN
ncbi:hypothetical protein [Peptoniphilus vaginalis]|uniref:hypothetical protein n=1 Tax=Peptoniphilus vaginalis TaxID=1756987 RepID=UPI0023F82188|nr:hypothetical protein [Peptoniphilus vaginalis]